MGFGGGVMLSDLTVSLFAQWLHRPQEFGRGSTSILLVSAIVGTITAHGTCHNHKTPALMGKRWAGGVAFMVVDSFLEQRGAWMRRLSSKRKKLAEWRSRRLRPLLAKLRLPRTKRTSDSLETLQLALEEEVRHPNAARAQQTPHTAHSQS
jgi:hypothetical protein